MSKWRFFKYKPYYDGSLALPLLVTNNTHGLFFRLNGYSNSDIPNKMFSIDYIRGSTQYEELTSLEFISLINKSGRAKVYQTLGIPSIENSKPIELTADIINPVLDTLKQNRARNGDSAHKFNEDKLEEILYAMVEKKLIRTLDNEKYWIES